MPRVQDALPSLDCRAWKGRSNPLLLSALRFPPESRHPPGSPPYFRVRARDTASATLGSTIVANSQIPWYRPGDVSVRSVGAGVKTAGSPPSISQWAYGVGKAYIP